jgi:putative redox protein
MGTHRVSKLGYDITVGTHTILADVPEKLGGKDEGPSPHDLLRASLAACTAITVQMYADRKAWPLKISMLK